MALPAFARLTTAHDEPVRRIIVCGQQVRSSVYSPGTAYFADPYTISTVLPFG